MKQFDWQRFGIRFLFALVLVMATFNPSGYSYFHWLTQSLPKLTPWLALAAITLTIGWAIYIRATFRSLGMIGLGLIGALFATIIWIFYDLGLLKPQNVSALVWIMEVLLALKLAIGMSWSHIRRRLSGQIDVDDVDN
ncbi:DUF6524 family protein [Teredinibacter sp. KSP-S5-2]|uniref:DUF6524 family protein n=1 Tax=Teredinibacter sp. KSP-S5-2 TaxID=3034506 RepID=UPI0029341138|nr:DUF6524 family protein [Teredinibacter sp. KSP-S5-2]WNO09152.1 DUF6524 family protein [Teredinibacter sp. KSP-S5-2]